MNQRMFKIFFYRPCPARVMDDMLRYDSMRLVSGSRTADGDYIDAVVRQSYGSRLVPTLERWASFTLGTRIESVSVGEDE